MSKLILLRHGQSQWNLENKFTGWVDVELSALGEQEAARAGVKLKDIQIDKAYTSLLKRAMNTCDIALKNAGKTGIPIERSEALNERHYGDLQGLDKDATRKKYGEEQVHIWRRSYDIPPPGDKAESLKDTAARTLPYFNDVIGAELKAGKNILIAAHGNSLRSIVMDLEKLTKEEVLDLNIPTGAPILYELDGDMNIISKKEL